MWLLRFLNLFYNFQQCFICRLIEFHCVGGCWAWTQGRCNICLGSQMFDHSVRSHFRSARHHLVGFWKDLKALLLPKSCPYIPISLVHTISFEIEMGSRLYLGSFLNYCSTALIYFKHKIAKVTWRIAFRYQHPRLEVKNTVHCVAGGCCPSARDECLHPHREAREKAFRQVIPVSIFVSEKVVKRHDSESGSH